MLTQEQFTYEFCRRMHEHRLWKHPYFKLVENNPSKLKLQQWAIQAGRIDQVFSEILENMINNPVIPTYMHEPIQNNLNDELGNGDPAKEHFTLFRNVLGVLNITEQEYNETLMNQATAKIISSLKEASTGDDILQILALMASEELICPKEFPLFLEAIAQLGTREDLSYFDAHITADVSHSEDLIHMCYSAAQSKNDLEQIFLWQSLDLENNVLFYDALLEQIKD